MLAYLAKCVTTFRTSKRRIRIFLIGCFIEGLVNIIRIDGKIYENPSLYLLSLDLLDLWTIFKSKIRKFSPSLRHLNQSKKSFSFFFSHKLGEPTRVIDIFLMSIVSILLSFLATKTSLQHHKSISKSNRGNGLFSTFLSLGLFSIINRNNIWP